jgi:sulfur relay (sulfurtransferase) complex TusBCD TusD component (DsrE family)
VTTLTIVIQDAPYEPSNKAWHALRFAGAALADDTTVRVFLLDRGVALGRKNHEVPAGKENLEKLLNELIGCGLEVQACGMCLKTCCLDERDLIDGIARGSMKALVAWTKTSDRVIAF